MRRSAAALLGALPAGALILVAVPASAQVDLLSPAVISVLGDVRLSAAGGEPSWLQGGFGKTRYGGAGSAGDRTTVRDGYWCWDTRFWNLGLRYAPDAETEILAQAMTGRTVTGFLTAHGWRVDAVFDSA